MTTQLSSLLLQEVLLGLLVEVTEARGPNADLPPQAHAIKQQRSNTKAYSAHLLAEAKQLSGKCAHLRAFWVFQTVIPAV